MMLNIDIIQPLQYLILLPGPCWSVPISSYDVIEWTSFLCPCVGPTPSGELTLTRSIGRKLALPIVLDHSIYTFFLAYSDKFPKMFSSSCGMECPSTANFCHQCGQQLNLSQISNKVASLGWRRKTVKEVFPSGISLRSIDYVHKCLR